MTQFLRKCKFHLRFSVVYHFNLNNLFHSEKPEKSGLDQPLRKRKESPLKSNPIQKLWISTSLELDRLKIPGPSCNSVKKSLIKQRSPVLKDPFVDNSRYEFGVVIAYSTSLYKSAQKRKYLATWKIDLVPIHRRHRSITISQQVKPKTDITKLAHTEEEIESDPDHGDEFEDSVGDSADLGKRQSIADMIMKHKLQTAQPISAKINTNQAPDIEIVSSSSEESSYEEMSEPETRTKRLAARKLHDDNAGMFEWCHEYDDLIEDIHSEIYTKWHPIAGVINYSNNFSPSEYEQKYNYLSAYMDEKAAEIRKRDKYLAYKKVGYNSIEAKHKANKVQETDHNSASPPRLRYAKASSVNVDSGHRNQPYQKSHSRLMKNTNLLVNETGESTAAPNDMLGYIDELGIFYVDLFVEDVELCNASINQDIGFFDKLLSDNSFKDYFKSVRIAFDMLKGVFKTMIKNTTGKRARLLLARQLNWSYFDNQTSGYLLDETKFTCYNNPIAAY